MWDSGMPMWSLILMSSPSISYRGPPARLCHNAPTYVVPRLTATQTPHRQRAGCTVSPDSPGMRRWACLPDKEPGLGTPREVIKAVRPVRPSTWRGDQDQAAGSSLTEVDAACHHCSSRPVTLRETTTHPENHVCESTARQQRPMSTRPGGTWLPADAQNSWSYW